MIAADAYAASDRAASEGHRRRVGRQPQLADTRPSWPGPRTGSSRRPRSCRRPAFARQRIPVACGFHSPLIAGAKEPLAAALGEAKFTAPRKPVYSNTTAAPHAAEPAAHRRQLAEHLVSPVQFADEIAAMYAAGRGCSWKSARRPC